MENIEKRINQHLEEFAAEAEEWFQDKQWLVSKIDYFNKFYSANTLKKASWKEFQEMGEELHCFSSNALAKKRALGRSNHPIENYRKTLQYIKYGEAPVNEKINTLVYGDSSLQLFGFGEASIIELVVYAFPQKYGFYNSRDIDALEFLGVDLHINRGEKVGDIFLRYNTAMKSVISAYRNTVGSRTSAPLPIEVDQFMSWLYIKNKSQSAQFPQIIEKLKVALKTDDSVLSNFTFYKTYKNYVQIKDAQNCIGKKKAHYEIIVRNKSQIWVELHFENKSMSEKDVFHESINLSEGLEWIDRANSKSIRVSGFLSFSDESVVALLVEKLKLLEDGVGDDVRAIINNDFLPILHSRLGESANLPLNQILFGPPGTGKTYNTINHAIEIIDPSFDLTQNRDEIKKKYTSFVKKGRIVFTTFHQSMSYEDFIEGIKPETNEKGEIAYIVQAGIFKNICEAATQNPGKEYVLIIDEINRGNISSIFGELITLIEADKRIGKAEEIEVILPYSKKRFGVPPNLFLIGAMNTADRSIEALDTALRRRFNFIEMYPDYEVLKNNGKLQGTPLLLGTTSFDLVEILQHINERIEILLDRDHFIGHSYFMPVTNELELKTAFSKQIIPLLQEYFFGDYGKISLVLGEGFCSGTLAEPKIFAKAKNYDDSAYSEKMIYKLLDPSKMDSDKLTEALSTLLKNKSEGSERIE